MKGFLTKQTPFGVAHYTTDQAESAIANGTPIVKVLSEKGDKNPVGSKGVVIGSILDGRDIVGYFVEWESTPDVPVFVADQKIARLS
ncbi:hypothetical protein [Bradyrhizobium elkanii]|uniref:hypothetical protein n=1 Tax=Bradyrhizobium elkanii TaxID=29448 RepID=UPI0003F93350|nr:hypothetical protein [Bradyrhizobium elkanii]